MNDPKKNLSGKTRLESLEDVKGSVGTKKTTSTKKKQGRPTKEELEQQRLEEEARILEKMPNANTFGGFLEFIFKALSRRLGPHWELTEEEKEEGSRLINNVAAKYFPLIGQYGEEIALLMWIAPVVGMRFYLTMELQMAAEKAKVEKNQQKVETSKQDKANEKND